jgi:hypothetical protein
MSKAITHKGWSLLTKDGQPVIAGSVHTDFRGDTAVITGGYSPHKPSSTGRVHTAAGREVFPGVFDLRWELQPPPGYTADELERDNPYNQWMHAE